MSAPLLAGALERGGEVVRGGSLAQVAEPGRRRLRLLVSAYACAPGRGSEHGVGWNWARALAPLAEVWVVTRERRRAAIAAWEREHGAIGVHWVFHECPRWLRALKPRIGVHAYYRCWQRLLLSRARSLHERLAFDSVLQLTMNGYREPGWLWRLPCRFAWGPIGGLQDADERFLALEDPLVRAQERLRRWLNRLTARFGPRARAARSRAALLLAANGEALAWARGGCRRHLVGQLLEAGVPEVAAPSGAPMPDRDPGAILWVGSGEPRKNPRFALLAFAALRRLRPQSTLTLVGLPAARQGELRAWARRRALDLAGVSVHAQLPRAELAAFYDRAAQFWFTSWRDTSGNVLLEALAHGCACIAFAHQGAADMLAGGAGALVPPGSPRAMLAQWTRAALRLLDRPELERAQGLRGSELAARRFAWSAKAELLVGSLRSVLTGEAAR